MKFEIDQLSKKLQNCKQENETLKSDLHVSDEHCYNWWMYPGSVVPVLCPLTSCANHSLDLC